MATFTLSDRNGIFTLDPEELAGTQSEPLEVETKHGNSIAQTQTPEPTTIKINVEGEESRVIDEMSEVLTENTRIVYCEIHEPKEDRFSVKDHKINVKEVIGKLQDCGFDLEIFSERTHEIHVKDTS